MSDYQPFQAALSQGRIASGIRSVSFVQTIRTEETPSTGLSGHPDRIGGGRDAMQQLVGALLGYLAPLGLSGLASGATWGCYLRALQADEALKVVPADKLSLLLVGRLCLACAP
jgi:hypothetical protein